METGYKGDYDHPMDGTFTVSDIDGDGKEECIVPHSSMNKKSKGLAYLKAATRNSVSIPHSRFQLD